MKSYKGEKKKYLVCPGKVESVRDGDWHYISAGQLISLYKVDSRDCKIVNSPESAAGIKWEDYIVLRPRTDGNYSLQK